jgi:hypothetical protein
VVEQPAFELDAKNHAIDPILVKTLISCKRSHDSRCNSLYALFAYKTLVPVA